MSMIAILLMSSMVTVIAVIGLADAVMHLLCWTARSLKASEAMRVTQSGAIGWRHKARKLACRTSPRSGSGMTGVTS